MLHLFKSAAARLFTYGLVGAIVVGLLVGAVRLALPFADLFRSELEGLLSEKLGLEVRVGRLGLRLAGEVPQLTLIDAELLDPDSGRTQLSLEQLRIELSLFASLRELAPHIESVTLVGAHLVIKRLEDGTVAVAGLEGYEGGDPAGMTFFLGNGRFLLADSDVRWIDKVAGAGASPLHFSDVQIRFENTGERHRIGVLARPFGERQSNLRLAGELHGKPRNPADWSGQLYLYWRGGNLEQLLKGRLPWGLSLGSAAVELESWNDLERGALARSQTRLAVGGLTAWSRSSQANVSPMHLDWLEGQLRWRKLAGGWQLDVKDLALTRDGNRRPESDLAMRLTTATDGAWTIEGANELLDLAEARDLLAHLTNALPEKLRLLQDIHPDGSLQDLRFRARQGPDLAPDWAVSGRIEGLRLQSRDRIPGVTGLDTEFAADENGGVLDLASKDLTLNLPLLFPEPIQLDELDGAIQWQHASDGGVRISVPEITASNADITGSSRFAISLPAGGGSPHLDLQVNFQDLDLASVRRYIPSRRLKKKKLVPWLEQAFESGRIPSGTVLFRGALSDFPFDEQQGRFQVLFGMEDASLRYHKDWPRLEGIGGEVQFLNGGMEIFVSRARFLDSDLVNAYARIPNLKKAVALEVVGRTDGPFADGLRVLGETPLRKKLGALAETLEAEGISRLDLDMAIPLPRKEGKVPMRLAGELTWPGPSSLTIKDRGIKLTDLDGTLHFTERSVHAESVAAMLWGVPVRLRVDTGKPGEDGKAATHIRADGLFPTRILAQRVPSPVWDFAKGRSRWELGLDIGSAKEAGTLPPIDFHLESDLSGVEVELPAPVGKPAAGTRRLYLAGALAKDRELLTLGGYGDLGIALGLTQANDGKLGLARGTFNLGGGAAQLPDGGGLELTGSIGTLDLPAWLNWWSGRKTSGDGGSGGRTKWRSVDVRVSRLLLTDMAINDVRVDLDQRGDRWEAKLSSRELEGRVSVPHRPRQEPVRIELARLDLKAVLGHDGEEGQAFAEGKRRADPRQAHTLDLSVERLLWGDNPLGRVALRSRPAPDGLDFTVIALDGPLMSIDGRGSWKRQGREQRTNLSIAAKGSDLGEFLRSLEFNSLFYRAPAEVDLALDWPGGPVQFSAADLKGNVAIEVGAGSLLEVEPGVGRMLGILNLEALQRRLSLDFSDLFDRGYAFEKISGELRIRNGQAEIRDLVIEGPSANVSIAGKTNLVEQEFDQIVTVTPRLGTGVAIASAVAGGPLIGAAVFLADQVSGGMVDKLGSHQYVISGPWAKPEIRRGKLGGSSDQGTERGHFLEDSGRAGAEGKREPKPAQARAAGAEALTESGTGKIETRPSRPGDGGGENLFLEGH